MRILLAEDDQPNRELLGRLLEHLGCEAVAVESGNAALDALGAPTADGAAGTPAGDGRSPREFDVILLDYLMPGIDGLETARRVRRVPGLETIPIVILSGMPLSDEDGTVPGPPLRFLMKPVRLSDLRDLLSGISGGG